MGVFKARSLGTSVSNASDLTDREICLSYLSLQSQKFCRLCICVGHVACKILMHSEFWEPLIHSSKQLLCCFMEGTWKAYSLPSDNSHVHGGLELFDKYLFIFFPVLVIEFGIWVLSYIPPSFYVLFWDEILLHHQVAQTELELEFSCLSLPEC